MTSHPLKNVDIWEIQLDNHSNNQTLGFSKRIFFLKEHCFFFFFFENQWNVFDHDAIILLNCFPRIFLFRIFDKQIIYKLNTEDNVHVLCDCFFWSFQGSLKRAQLHTSFCSRWLPHCLHEDMILPWNLLMQKHIYLCFVIIFWGLA